MTLFPFANARHDRHSELRGDDEALAAMWKQGRALLVGHGHLSTDDDRLRWYPTDRVPDGERILLGTLDSTPYWAVIVERIADEDGPATLRQAGPILHTEVGAMAAQAVGIANWHRTHGFCARCGAPTAMAAAGYSRKCASCGATHFPRIDPAVIMLATDDQDRALLGSNTDWPQGRYSTLAGFVEPGESIEDAVRREIREESGIEIGDVRYAASQPWPMPSSLMLGFFAVATTHDIQVDAVEMRDAQWFDRDQVRALLAERDAQLPNKLSISRWLIDTWLAGRHQI